MLAGTLHPFDLDGRRKPPRAAQWKSRGFCYGYCYSWEDTIRQERDATTRSRRARPCFLDFSPSLSPCSSPRLASSCCVRAHSTHLNFRAGPSTKDALAPAPAPVTCYCLSTLLGALVHVHMHAESRYFPPRQPDPRFSLVPSFLSLCLDLT
jgi:hypothetical protein